MATSAAIVWEVRTTGSDTVCSGGFKSGASGTDRSQQDAAHATLTTLSVVNADTTKITVSLTDYTVIAADVGNTYLNTGGTSTAGLYEITAVDTVANTWTLDRSIGVAAQTVAGVMGGAAASPGKVCLHLMSGNATAGNTIHVKSGTYTMSSTGNVAAGRINLDIMSCTWIGYNATREDNGTKPIFAAGANTMTPVTLARADYWFQNFEIHATGRTGCTGMTLGGSSGSGDCWVYRCKVHTCQSVGIGDASAATSHIIGCEVTGITGGAAAINLSQGGTLVVGCYVHDNTVTGVVVNANARVISTISETNTGGTDRHGFNANANAAAFINCVAYGNAGHGFAGCSTSHLINCVAEGQTGATRIGFDNSATDGVMLNCGVYNNTTNVSVTTGRNVQGTLTGTGSFFTDAAGGDFTLNNTASAGAILRSTGFPASLPGATGTSAGDVGTFQVAAAGGAVMFHPGMSGGVDG